jgi:hypothetical protein
MRDVLKQCFSVTQGDAKLWENYLSQTDEVRCLYYPSACDDFRPFLFTDPECQAYTGYTPPLGYEAPNLFIFSDYLPGRRGENFYNIVLWADKNTRIEVDSLWESRGYTQGIRVDLSRQRPTYLLLTVLPAPQ